MSTGRRSSPRQRSARAADAHLDELLGFEEAGPPVPTRAASRPWLLRSVLQTFVLSAVVYTAFHVVNLAPPYALIVAVCAGAVLIRHGVRATAEPAWQRTADVVRPPGPRHAIGPGGWYADSDGMLAAVRRWDRRLEWGTTAPERFHATVVARLRELADERLRQQHAITRASDPVRARGLLGEELWTLLHDRVDRVSTPRDVAAALSQLESLSGRNAL
jgi:hypothetical protein